MDYPNPVGRIPCVHSRNFTIQTGPVGVRGATTDWQATSVSTPDRQTGHPHRDNARCYRNKIQIIPVQPPLGVTLPGENSPPALSETAHLPYLAPRTLPYRRARYPQSVAAGTSPASRLPRIPIRRPGPFPHAGGTTVGPTPRGAVSCPSRIYGVNADGNLPSPVAASAEDSPATVAGGSVSHARPSSLPGL